MGMIALGFLGFITLLVTLFFILKWTAAAIFRIPGADSFFSVLIEVIPYALFLTAFTLLWKIKHRTISNTARAIGVVFILLGVLTALVGVVLDLCVFLKIDEAWLRAYKPFVSYPLGIMLLLAFLGGLALASGTAPEKDWRERSA